MKTFVTGGSGFLGRHLIKALVNNNHEVVAIARSDAAAETVGNAGARVVRADLDDLKAIRTAMEGCEQVFHSAAIAEEWGKKEDFYRVNVQATADMVTTAKLVGVKTFVHIGTEAILAGHSAIKMADENQPITTKPSGLYSWSKGLADELVRASNDAKMKTVVVRPRFIWGADDSSVLPKMIKAVKAGYFRWIAGGNYLTSTCHVDNVCEGALLAAEKGVGGEAYFLTDGRPVQYKEFVGAMMRARGVNPGDRHIPFWAARMIAGIGEAIFKTLGITNKKPQLTRTALRIFGQEVTVDDSKARKTLGYIGKKSITDGLKEMENYSS